MTTTMASETVQSSTYRGNHFVLLQKMGWAVGDVIESVEPELDGTHWRIKLARLEDLIGGQLFPDGTINAPNMGLHGQPGWRGGIVTFCQWPVGGKVTAVSLNCRDWRKVAAE